MKDFVLYQEALALRELGFDEPCFGYYDTEGLQFGVIFWWNRENKNSLFVESEKTNNPKISAPTYSQAFRFFREKYGLIGWVEGKRFYKFCIESFIPTDDQLNLSPFPTYEVAELACLKKLIEIVKNKAI